MALLLRPGRRGPSSSGFTMKSAAQLHCLMTRTPRRRCARAGAAVDRSVSCFDRARAQTMGASHQGRQHQNGIGRPNRRRSYRRRHDERDEERELCAGQSLLDAGQPSRVRSRTLVNGRQSLFDQLGHRALTLPACRTERTFPSRKGSNASGFGGRGRQPPWMGPHAHPLSNGLTCVFLIGLGHLSAHRKHRFPERLHFFSAHL